MVYQGILYAILLAVADIDYVNSSAKNEQTEQVTEQKQAEQTAQE